MKKGAVRILGFFMISSGFLLAGGPRVQPAVFTLAAYSGDPPPIPFTLARGSTELTALSGVRGGEIAEETYTALGLNALASRHDMFFIGDFDTAIGASALMKNHRGIGNTAIGDSALRDTTNGTDNTACGAFALWYNILGSHNTAIGNMAGAAEGFTNGNWNIFLGAKVKGDPLDANTIRIGAAYNSLPYDQPSGQNRTYIAGIVETPFSASDEPSVVGITSEGRLGTISSDMLPEGPQGPPGEGLVPGSLLFLAAGFTPPGGYNLIGTTEMTLFAPGSANSSSLHPNRFRRLIKISVNVYQKL